MLLIFEIILTIVSWRKGWRGYALIPGACALLIGFILGALAGTMGHSQAQFRQLSVALLPLDLVCMGVLIWMAAKGRKGVHAIAQKVESNEMQVAASKA